MSEIGEQVARLHATGLRAADIAHRLGVAQATVHYHLRRLAEPQPGPAPPAASRQAPPPAASLASTRDQVARLLAEGISRIEIAQRLGVAKSTVSYHAKQLGATSDTRFARRYDWPVVQAFYDDGHSLSECMKVFGFSRCAWHHAVQRGAITPRPGFLPLEEVFAAGTRRGRDHLKRRLLRAGVKDARCERCGIIEWLGDPLTVELHHVNGDRYDNRLENLQLLCPNCHSQTTNHAGRNGRPGRPGRGAGTG